MVKNLILTGGWAHDFVTSAAALADVLEPVAKTTIVDEMALAGRALDDGEFDVLTVYACWFTMTDTRYTEEQRREWARTTPDGFREAVHRHVRAGGGLCVLHTGLLCFTDWPDWPRLVGGDWTWGRSWHPTPATMRAERHGSDEHPIVAGIDHVEVFDERYCDIDASPHATVLLTSDGPEGRFPTLWVHEVDGGRRAYSSLGHDGVSLTEATHARLLRRLVVWSGGGDGGTIARIA